MKRITSLLLTLLLASLVMFNGQKQVLAGEPVENGNVEITTVLPDNNKLITNISTTGSYKPIEESGEHTFVYHVVNGKVYNEVPSGGFKFHSGMKIISVFTSGEQNAVLFLDTNGEFLGVDYVTNEIPSAPETTDLSKPGFTVSTENPFGILTEITDHTILFVNYEQTETTSQVNINGINYPRDEVVTLTNDTPVTWLEHNIPVWYGETYSFTALSDRTITKSDDFTSSAIVSSIKHLDLRGDGSLSHLGQVYIPNSHELIEVGYLLHTNNNLELTMDTEGVTVLRSNSVNEFRNEFLRTVSSENVMNTNVRAYAVVSDGTERTVIYEEIRTSLVFNLNVLEAGFKSSINTVELKYGHSANQYPTITLNQIGNTGIYKVFIPEQHISSLFGFELIMDEQGKGEKLSNWITSHTFVKGTNNEVFFVDQWINDKWSATMNLGSVKTLSFDGGQISTWTPDAYWLRVSLFNSSNNEFSTYNWQGSNNYGNDNVVENKVYSLKLVEELGVSNVVIRFYQYDNGHQPKDSTQIPWDSIGSIELHGGWPDGRWEWISN